MDTDARVKKFFLKPILGLKKKFCTCWDSMDASWQISSVLEPFCVAYKNTKDTYQ